MFVKTATPSSSPQALGPAGMGLPVIDTNTLRQAALQNSWRRDQRVARRRLAFRWVLWWLWKYRYVLLAVCAVLAAYLYYRFGQVAHPTASPAAPIDASVIPAPAPRTDVQLRAQPQLLEPKPSSVSADLLPSDTQPLFQLKPEIQLKIKEIHP